MKTLKHYIIKNINEGFKIGKTKAKKYIYTPEDKDELIDILRKRLQKHSNADLNYIDTSKITDMSYLFLTFDPGNIDISGWDVSNVTNMSFMFTQCKNFNCDLSNWDVSNVKNMGMMFYGCKNFDCDLSKWDVSNVEDMTGMFNECNISLPSWYKN